MSTHNICFREEIRKIFSFYPHISGARTQLADKRGIYSSGEIIMQISGRSLSRVPAKATVCHVQRELLNISIVIQPFILSYEPSHLDLYCLHRFMYRSTGLKGYRELTHSQGGNPFKIVLSPL